MADNCIFCRIVAGEVPAKLVYQDETVIAFRDIQPQAPVHVLVVPREHIAAIADLSDAQTELAGRTLVAVAKVARAVEGRVRLVEAMADAEFIASAGAFDVILANILSGVIRPLLPSFRSALRPQGRLVVSGILQSESEEVSASAVAAGFVVAREDREEEWWSALLLPAEP